MQNVLLIWDIDGTLIHCGSCGRDALNKTFKALFGIENAFAYAKIGSAMDAVLLKEILINAGISIDKKNDILNKYAMILKQVLAEYKENKVLPGIQELLAYTQNSKNIYNCIVTSNFETGAKIKLASNQLDHYFETGGFGDLEAEKWHAVEKAIEKTENHFNVSFHKENIYMFGDTWYDIQSAKKVGINSIAVATGWTAYETLKQYEPDYLFKDLSQYEEIIRLLDI